MADNVLVMRIPKSTKAQLTKKAKELGVPLSELVRDSLEQVVPIPVKELKRQEEIRRRLDELQTFGIVIDLRGMKMLKPKKKGKAHK